MIFPKKEVYSDLVINLVQAQLAGGLASGSFNISPMDAAYFIALQIQLNYGGKLKSAINKFNGSLDVLLKRFLPASIISEDSSENWNKNITTFLKNVKDMNPDENPEQVL